MVESFTLNLLFTCIKSENDYHSIFMNEFIIVFRETLEATLIVGIIYVFLLKQQISGAIGKLWIEASPHSQAKN